MNRFILIAVFLFVLIFPVWCLAAEQDYADFLEKFHGHTCAGSLMGARLGLAARAALEGAGGEGKLKAKMFSLTCDIDGVQITAGTTYGNRAVEIENLDQMRLILTAEKNGKQVEATLTKLAEEKGKLFGTLKKQAKAFPPNSPQKSQLEKEMAKVLTWFREAPNTDVVVINPIK